MPPTWGPPGPPPPPPMPPTPMRPIVNPALISPFLLGPERPTMWQRAWPLSGAAAGPGVLYGALLSAVVCAVALPPDRPGIGWAVAGLGLLAPPALMLLRAPGRTAPARAESLLWSVAALGLLCVGFFRAAGWLFALCVLTAFGCLALALGRHRRVPGVLAAPGTLVISAFRALPWAGTAVRAPRRDASRLLVSIGLGLALLVVFGALFASADAAFNSVVTAIVPSLGAADVARWLVVAAVTGALALGAAFLAANPSAIGDAEPRAGRPVRRVEWLVPVGAVLGLFVLFVAVQLAVLFGDRDYVLQTVGLTFAEYARKGFWQLLVITLLTLVVMALTARKAPRGTAADRWLLRAVLGALAACSLVVVGSALWRMNVYEQAYGFTRLRLFVSAVELWLGGLFVLVMLAGLRLRARAGWLGRAAAGLWVATLLGLAVLNPDRFIAGHNVDRAGAGNSDIWYLRTLSADAAPELDRLPRGARECALSDIADDLDRGEDDWRGWNLARSRARQIVPGPVTVDGFPCYRRY